MDQLRNDAKKLTDTRLRIDLFAKVLGDEWKTDGDGIYRRVSEPNVTQPTEPPPNESSLQDGLDDALAREIASRDQPGASDRERSPDRNGSFWRRR